MTIKKVITTTLFVGSVFLLSACVGQPTVHKNDFVYNGYNFGANRDTNYKQGVQDGCKTSDGDYTKNHNQFNHNQSYHVGWEHGRIKCKGK
ncbi:MAG: hypothetical protein U9R27_09745 [Campylobacterota bacterium]|nr:hypothetical protein [Campylobacterota bacterium]